MFVVSGAFYFKTVVGGVRRREETVDIYIYIYRERVQERIMKSISVIKLTCTCSNIYFSITSFCDPLAFKKCWCTKGSAFLTRAFSFSLSLSLSLSSRTESDLCPPVTETRCVFLLWRRSNYRRDTTKKFLFTSPHRISDLRRLDAVRSPALSLAYPQLGIIYRMINSLSR